MNDENRTQRNYGIIAILVMFGALIYIGFNMSALNIQIQEFKTELQNSPKKG